MPFIPKKVQTIFIHILFWGIVFLMPLLESPSMPSMHEPPPNGMMPPMPPPNGFAPPQLMPMPMPMYDKPAPSILVSIISTLTLVSVFYLNANVLVPRFLFKKDYFLYLISSVLVVTTFFGIEFGTKFLLFKGSSIVNIQFPFFAVVPVFFTLLLSIGYRFFIRAYEKEILIQERDNEQLRTELKFLRSQINPHFLFNVLNSFVSLARKKSDLLEPSLIKLSELMQYMVYDADADYIAVAEEITYLKNYIELQKLRFGNSLALSVKFEESNTKSRQIAPMLFIPLVENAFKHGTGFIGKQQIDVEFIINDKEIIFTVKNLFQTEGVTKDGNSGIGLSNLYRRLALIYPDKHQLVQTTMDNVYFTRLIINFSA